MITLGYYIVRSMGLMLGSVVGGTKMVLIDVAGNADTLKRGLCLGYINR
jgi:hypothetical protein